MTPKMRKLMAIGVLAGLWLAGASVFTVSEIEQVLIVRLGAPTGVITAPGLQVKVPLIDSVISYDARLLILTPPTEQVILGDQKRLEVKTYTRYRIQDPLRFYQSVRSLEMAQPQLTQILSSALRREMGQVMLHALLSEERKEIVERIQTEVTEKAKELGIDVVEVRVHRADLPLETSQAIYDRMKSERQREAKELRAQGFEWAQQIQAKAERERTVLLSEAERQSKITRGEADAQASRVLANAYSQDPQFYKVYRSLQTYRQALAESGPTMVLSPDSEFLRVLKTGPGQSSSHAPRP